jgi:hypothetical protein
MSDTPSRAEQFIEALKLKQRRWFITLGRVVSFVRRRGASTLVLAFIAFVLVVWAIVPQPPPPPPETPAQTQARREAYQAEVQRREAEAQRQAAAAERKASLCHLQSVCVRYGRARQECATAGDYKNCVDIKMGTDATDLYPCMNDGGVFNQPSDMPSRVACCVGHPMDCLK